MTATLFNRPPQWQLEPSTVGGLWEVVSAHLRTSPLMGPRAGESSCTSLHWSLAADSSKVVITVDGWFSAQVDWPRGGPD